MSFPRRQFLRLSAAAAVLPAMSHVGWAQGYPTRQVRVIVPFAPAGPTDVAARLIATKLSDTLKQQFFVENVAGAGGNIGMGQAAKAAPESAIAAANSPIRNLIPYLQRIHAPQGCGARTLWQIVSV